MTFIPDTKKDIDLLNKTGRSKGYINALNNHQYELFVNDIYTEYIKYCELHGKIQMFSLSNMIPFLLANDKTNPKSKLQIQWHYQGTSYYPSIVFFTEPYESRDDCIERIIHALLNRWSYEYDHSCPPEYFY